MSELILKTFGCSHTYGSELPNPNEDAWPILLGKKLNLKTINHGRIGASNEEIFYEAVSKSYIDEKYLIIILTTHIDRMYWPSHRILLNDPLPSHHVNKLGYESYLHSSFHTDDRPIGEKIWVGSKNPTIKAYIKHHFHTEHVTKHHKFLFETCKELLESRGNIVYVFDYICPIFTEYETMYSYLRKSEDPYVNELEAGHWNAKAQILWTDYIYNIIKNDNLGNICSVT